MARFGARCSPTAAPQRIRNKARFARLRGGVPTDQFRDAQPRKTAWQDRDKDRERQLSSHLAIRVAASSIRRRSAAWTTSAERPSLPTAELPWAICPV